MGTLGSRRFEPDLPGLAPDDIQLSPAALFQRITDNLGKSSGGPPAKVEFDLVTAITRQPARDCCPAIALAARHGNIDAEYL